jgi:undecaprenyl-diphosphatase
MGWFDNGIIFFCNQLAHHSWLFDNIVVFFSNSDLMKGGVMFAGFYFAWFVRGGDSRLNRSRLLSALLGTIIALAIARYLAHALPHRARPILNPALHFQPPYGTPDQSNWTIWSSFPSDHAALFFAVLTGIWLASRRAGIVMLVYLLVAICFPRMYIGIHYPTDILAGAALGVGSVLLCSWNKIREFWTLPILAGFERYPAISYALLFFVSFQIATLFWDLRTFLFLFDVSL